MAETNSAPLNPCPICGAETEIGFGLAGGGYGVYLYCEACEGVVSKTECDEGTESSDGRS